MRVLTIYRDVLPIPLWFTKIFYIVLYHIRYYTNNTASVRVLLIPIWFPEYFLVVYYITFLNIPARPNTDIGFSIFD